MTAENGLEVPRMVMDYHGDILGISGWVYVGSILKVHDILTRRKEIPKQV